MDYKILINQQHPFALQMLANATFVTYENSNGEKVQLEKKTLQAFLKLQETLAQEGVHLDIVSAYRSELEQQALSMALSSIYVAPPGSSEHHSGLCLDIGLVKDQQLISNNEDLLNDTYLSILEQQVIPRLATFGFILRYPKNKEAVTGYAYEPWHYRYVGVATAKVMVENNLTLEEYHILYNRSGVLLVDKPSGMTSRDVVNRISHIFDTKKVGHNGTLDPLATGLLVVTINRATKINQYLTATKKTYIATILMGQKTDTGDISGKILKTSHQYCTKEEIKKVLQAFPKTYEQEVPIYSAVKIEGKKLYEYARKQQQVVLPKRRVEIYQLELLEVTDRTFTIVTTVSKGCYIRSLIQDLADLLGIPLTMQALRRTTQGKFKLEQAIPLADITARQALIPIAEALDISVKQVPTYLLKKVENGAPIANVFAIEDKVLLVNQDQPLAIYHAIGDKLQVEKML